MKRERKQLVEPSPPPDFAILKIDGSAAGNRLTAVFCQAVTFPLEDGPQELSYTATERETQVWRSDNVTIDDNAVILARWQTNRWWIIVQLSLSAE